MLYGVCCMLYVVCCMLYVACCMLYVVCCMLYVVCMKYNIKIEEILIFGACASVMIRTVACSVSIY